MKITKYYIKVLFLLYKGHFVLFWFSSRKKHQWIFLVVVFIDKMNTGVSYSGLNDVSVIELSFWIISNCKWIQEVGRSSEADL